MDRQDAIRLYQSKDWRERFKGRYWIEKIDARHLGAKLNRMENGRDDSDGDDQDMIEAELHARRKVLKTMEKRAELLGIDLGGM